MKKQLSTLSVGIIASVVIGLTAVASAGQDTADQDQKLIEAMFKKGPQEEDVYRAQKLLITATGSLKPLRLAPSVASVVTAEEIRAMGATSLDEVLETVPGLHVVPSSSWFSSIWSIRGVHTSINPEALLLVNGVPLTFNYTGSRGAGFRMPVEMISRVEVVRGPGSALHGADAFSGVINVITKDNFEIAGNQGGARLGSFDGYDGWLQHGGQYGGWDLALGLEWQKSTGDEDRIVKRDQLTLRGNKLSNAPGPLDTQHDTLDGNLQLRRGDFDLHLYGSLQQVGAGPGGTQTLTYGNDLDSSFLLTDLAYRNDHSVRDWELGGRLYYSYIYADSFVQYYPKGFPPAFNILPMMGEPIQTSQDGGLDTFAVYSGLADHRLRLGAGCKSYEFTPDQYKNFNLNPAPAPPSPILPTQEMVHITDPNQRYMPDANRQLWYGLVQDEWHLARRWEFTVGVRYDEYSDFGATTNPRAALVWETLPELTTKLLYGQAFRAPSFSEQYLTKNPQVQSNRDLNPAEIETMELAFDFQPQAGLRTALNLFYATTEGMVQQIKLPGDAIKTYHNYNDLRSDGFEVELEWQALEQLKIKTDFAYQRSWNTKVDAVVPDAPEMQFYFNPRWDFLPDWSLDGQYYWIGERHRDNADPRADVPDYHVVNLILRRANIAKHWEAAFAVRNLFAEDGREPSPYDPAALGGAGAWIPDDYPIASRALWAELRFHY